tara:strand:+ start:7022 stop:7264 length:243 start_codon:yes stop_codon:yes gene_type:complete
MSEKQITVNDSCDCCTKGWDKKNEFGRCRCICSECGEMLRDCKYEGHIYDIVLKLQKTVKDIMDRVDISDEQKKILLGNV